MAAGTVQSRSPSEIWSESGPWPETESPTWWPIRQTSQAATSVSSSGTAVTATPATTHPGAVGHQPGERADPERVARLTVGAGVGEEPAGDAEREADHQQDAGGGDPAEGRDQHQRAPVPEVGAPDEWAVGRREQRSHGPPIFARRRPVRRSHAGVLGAPTSPV